MAISRRAWIGGAIGFAAVGGTGYLAATRGDSAGTSPTPTGELDELLDAFLASEPENCLRIVADALRDGMPRDRVLATIMLAPAMSGGDTSDIHAMAVMPAVQRFSREATTPRERNVPLLWSAANAHAWSHRERVRYRPGRIEGLEEALSIGLATGDVEAAERAAALLSARDGADTTAAGLALHATRPHGDPHVAIWAAQARRLLPQCGAHATEIVRSVARYMARRGPPSDEPTLLDPDERDPIGGAELAGAIRGAHDVPLDGLRSMALWEAMALLTIETRLADTSATGIGVHQTTLLDALLRTWAAADDDERALALSRGVAWIVDSHRQNAEGAEEASAITETTGNPFALASDDPLAGYRAALGAVARDEASFLNTVRSKIAEGVDNTHDLKHWYAVLGVARHLRGESRTRWLATLALVWPARSRSRWPRFDEADAIAAELG